MKRISAHFLRFLIGAFWRTAAKKCPVSRHRSEFQRKLILACWSVIFTACSNNIQISSLFSFERAASLSFVCTERTTGTPAPLSRCGTFGGDGNIDNYVLYALVAQSSRGEVGVVELDYRRKRYRLVDTDVRIPGFTFVPTGEIPSAIVTPTLDTSTTYIAHIGAQSVWGVDSTSFFPNNRNVEPQVRGFDTSPTALALSPDETLLFTTLPDESRIAVLPIAPGTVGEPQLLDLTASTPTPTITADPANYQRVCPPSASVVEAVPAPTRTPITLGNKPQPIAFLVDDDPQTSSLLVADASFPVIHRFSLPDLNPLPPLAPGVPLRQLALTPRVPSNVDGGGEGVRYLYGIDATDGSLLVMNYDTGAVLNVGINPLDPSDRIIFPSIIRDIEVITPSYSREGLCTLGSEIDEDASQIQLRGVFLAVALGNGRLEILDIYDLDAPCRGGDQCQNPTNEDDQVVFIKRHRPRMATFIGQLSSIFGIPSMAGEGSPVRIEADGRTIPNNVPDINALEACPERTVQIFPTSGSSPLICAVTDPWVDSRGTWIATYNGEIPNSSGQRGNFSAEGSVLLGEASFCAAGVLGRADVEALAASEPERAYGGDQLVITAEIRSRAPSSCQSLIEQDAAGRRVGPAFQIISAYADRLELDSNTLSVSPKPYAEVVNCFEEFVEYEVRSRDAYVVQSGTDRFLHRVREQADKRCAVDTTLSPQLQGRALAGRPYRDHWVTFSPGTLPEGIRNAEFRFEIGRVPDLLVLDLNPTRVGVLPTVMHYSTVDEHLYILDAATEGLSRVNLREFKVANKVQ